MGRPARRQCIIFKSVSAQSDEQPLQPPHYNCTGLRVGAPNDNSFVMWLRRVKVKSVEWRGNFLPKAKNYTTHRLNDSTIQRFNDSTIQRFNNSTIQQLTAIFRVRDRRGHPPTADGSRGSPLAISRTEPPHSPTPEARIGLEGKRSRSAVRRNFGGHSQIRKRSVEKEKISANPLRNSYFRSLKIKCMVVALDKLEKEDYKRLTDAFPMIAVLIGAADGHLDKYEIDNAHRIAVIRSHSFDADLKPFFGDVAKDFRTKIEDVVDVAPSDEDQLQAFLSKELEKCSPVLQKLTDDLALRIHQSMRSFARHIAESSGGFLNYLSVTAEEEALIDLDMIEYKPSI